MGWDYSRKWKNLDHVYRSILGSAQRSGWTILARRATGSMRRDGRKHYWMVLEKPGHEPIIVVSFIERRGGDLGIKGPLSESEFPYAADCPLSYLDMAPVANEDWRKLVRSFHGEPEREPSSASNPLLEALNRVQSG